MVTDLQVNDDQVTKGNEADTKVDGRCVEIIEVINRVGLLGSLQQLQDQNIYLKDCMAKSLYSDDGMTSIHA